MIYECSDGSDIESIDWAEEQRSAFATSKMVMFHDLLQSFEKHLADILKVNYSRREELAAQLQHLFSVATSNSKKLDFLNGGRDLITIHTENIQHNLERIEWVNARLSELIKLSLTRRVQGCDEPQYEPIAISCEEVQQYRDEIREILEKARISIPINGLIVKHASDRYVNGTYYIDPMNLLPIPDGISGSYFLLDSSGEPTFVVKPVDEDISCLNNPKGFGVVEFHNMFNTQLYRSVFREKAVATIAALIGVMSIAPATTLAILMSDRFYDLSDKDPSFGPATKEKLCSCMEFIPNAKTLFEASQDLQALGLSDDEIASRFDQTDFEDVNILLWTAGERDGHGGNILVYRKGEDCLGNEILGFKKIDNGLSLPEEDTKFLRNSLIYLPNASSRLSEAAINKILNIDTAKIEQIHLENHLEGSFKATCERIGKLKQIVSEYPALSIKEIHRKLCS